MIALVLAAGCRKDPDKAGGVPSFDEVERVVTIGDNLGSNPSAGDSYLALLAENDDELFPEFAGLDLATRLPDAEVVRLDRGGDSYYTLAEAERPIRTCGPDPEPCVDPDDRRPTLVIVELGMNDLVAAALQLVSDPALRADPGPIVEAFRADVALVLEAARDPALFPREAWLVVTNTYDPSDDVGDLAALVTTFFPVDGADEVTPELALEVLHGFGDAIAAEAAAAGADLCDVHGAFLGHGMHYDDPASPHYDPADPTLWLATVVDPNLRGAHEIRRTLWGTLTGEAVTVLPGDLPIVVIEGIPPVPDDGWATGVAAAELTLELVDDAGTVYPNVAVDPNEALGVPDAGLTGGIVAVGTTGAYLVVERSVSDGEGEDLVVLELGALTGGTPEPYRVSVATAPEGPWTQLADAFGERAFDLGAVGVASASYVRIESLAQPAEVLGGLGSPFYPGPEIDAVGAVYP